MYYPAFSLAIDHAGLDDTDRVFAYLEDAYRDRETQICYLGGYGAFARVRSDRRYADTIKRLGLE